MTELFINNQRVDLNDKMSIKLTDENTYFTKSSKYTYDIEIPLKGNPNNIRIFGSIHRLDVTKSVKSMPAKLRADNRTIIDGLATVTSISESTIKIQIIAGTAAMNFISKNEKTYIDELKLGYLRKDNTLAITNDAALFNYTKNMTDAQREKYMFGQYGETNCVFFPVYKESNKGYYNNIIRARFDGEDDSKPYHLVFAETLWTFLLDEEHKFWEFMKSAEGTVAAQPYVCFIIRKIFDALGYSVTVNEIESSVLKNVFIANGAHITDFAQCLPHWTVSEFMTYVENFFGVVFRLDDTTKIVEIKSRDTFYNGTNTEIIEDVEDEYSVSSDANESKDITDSNIKYTFNNADPYKQIDEDIIKDITKKTFTSYDELYSYWYKLASDNKPNYLYEAAGKQYMNFATKDDDGNVTSNKLIEVNQYRALVRNESENSNELELKISPVEMMVGFFLFYDGQNTKIDKWTCNFENPPIPVMVPTVSTYVEQVQSLQDMIEGSKTETSERNSIMEVAMNDGIFQNVTSPAGVKTTFPWPFVLTDDLIRGSYNRGFSFELNKVDGRKTMYDAVFGQLNTLNTKSEYCIKFVTKKMPDVMKRFVINNRAFIAEKIEYKIDAKGVNEEKTGYFYEAGS